jgi:hypothetical protein
MKMQNSKRKMQNTKEFINKAIFKHPPLNPLPSREGK